MTKKKTTDERVGSGRTTSYKPEYADQAYKLCLLGATDKDLADFFEVTEQTINNWKLDFPVFFESIKLGKQIADSNVAYKLYNRAIGYSYEEDHTTMRGEEIVETKNIKKHMPSDTTAAIFWLKNRNPSKWRDKKDVDVQSGGQPFAGFSFLPYTEEAEKE